MQVVLPQRDHIDREILLFLAGERSLLLPMHCTQGW